MPGFKAAVPLFAALLLIAAADRAAFAQLASDPATIRYVVAPHGNEARYRVREQLAGIDFPNDAIGKTTLIEGGITVTATGAVIEEESKFTIDLASLTSDKDRRDGFIKRNTLQTEQYPSAVFVPTRLENLRFPLPQSGDVTFQMLGNLTIRGVSRPVTWAVTANVANGALTGEAKTKFTFADFELEKPRVRSVLSVDDDIGLEYTFFLVAR